ncbi:MAG: hypothetical protein ABH848_03735 [Candidatus Omnitrophota bacterium]
MKIDLRKKVSKSFLNILNSVSRSGDSIGVDVCLVGGPVRDIFLGRDNHDLDFVIEGDAISFAEKLNSQLKGSVKKHPAFKTATITLKKISIDLATARKESYERIASYPKVKPASIREDLYRRDFTINAMAIALNKKTFGNLVDFYNGYNDLMGKKIKILHKDSFKDDPTRIFRAVRFATRFDFKIDDKTKSLMKEAVMKGYVGEVNKGRIRKEIEAFLREKDPLKCLASFSKLM